MIDKDGNEYDLSFIEQHMKDDTATFYCKYEGMIVEENVRKYLFHYWTHIHDSTSMYDPWHYDEYCRVTVVFTNNSDYIDVQYKTPSMEGWSTWLSSSGCNAYIPLTRFITNYEAENAIFNTDTNTSHVKP